MGSIAYGALWLAFARDTFGWEAVGTLAVFMMTLFIQRTNRRDNLALHAKLDELLRVDRDADRSSLTSTSRSLKRSNGIGIKKCARMPIDPPDARQFPAYLPALTG